MANELLGFISNLRSVFADPTCSSCRRVATQFDVRHAIHVRDGRFPGKLRPVSVHGSFKELDACARVHGCASCRAFRQALFSRQISHNDNAALFTMDGPILVTLVSTPEPILRVSIGHSTDALRNATISCWPDLNGKRRELPLSPTSTDIDKVAGTWLRDCRKNHADCGRGWSSRNPTRLVRILPDSEKSSGFLGGQGVQVRLVLGANQDHKEDYVALSYSWGANSASHEAVRTGRTTTNNIDERLHGFDVSVLPATIQDAIEFTKSIGIQYIWIDSICIIQQGDDMKDFFREAPTMHEVYGNACLTLCVCSNDQAVDPMFGPRSAWSFPPQECRLSQYFLQVDDEPIDEVRLRSHLANRAWTLQEERLSERIIYWTAHRMYWSCSQMQRTESGRVRTTPRHLRQNGLPKDTLAYPQGFLRSCWRGEEKQLHATWLDVAKSYCLRLLTNPDDRFAAISGLAARYAHASPTNRYLAGLWKHTFPRDLSWSVKKGYPADKVQSLRTMAPSWSWTSVSCGSDVEVANHTWNDTSTPAALELLDAYTLSRPDLVPTIELLISINDALPSHHNDETTTIAIGEAVKIVKVKSRMRSLLTSTSQFQPWSSVISHASNTASSPQFSFKYPERDTFSVDKETGIIVVYEKRQQEMLGQLDYAQDAVRFPETAHRVQCLEIRKGIMLLVEQQCGLGYERIGIMANCRDGFFRDIESNTYLLQ